ncbi:MAG: BsuPI-related putative proteinase inhibitor [Gemmatimonadaceae bacterium]
MQSRSLVVALLSLLATSATACGPRSHAAEPAARKRVAGGPPIASSLDVQLRDAVSFAFHVTNNATKRLELTFPNGLTHDLVILDDAGREVWRWSEGRMFTQTLQNHVLETNETVSYAAEWSPAEHHGAFTAVARLNSENYPVEQRVRFTLP